MSITSNEDPYAEIQIGTQVTSRYGAGLVQWIEDSALYTVMIYGSGTHHVLHRADLDFWPPRPKSMPAEDARQRRPAARAPASTSRRDRRR